MQNSARTPASGSLPEPSAGVHGSFLTGFPDGVLGATYSILSLPSSFLRGPFGLGLGVAGHLADRLFNPALYLISDARDATFIHDGSRGAFV
jgi:hypothetical protein